MFKMKMKDDTRHTKKNYPLWICNDKSYGGHIFKTSDLNILILRNLLNA